MGSGTGPLARLFLENGNRVFGVEPNPEMRRAGERLLRRYGRFTSVAARAEDTTLTEGSVDPVTAGQAFHWFDPGPTRREFARILKPGGYVALIWNTRRKEGEPFLAGYEELLHTYGTDYREVYHGRRGSPESIRGFFRPDPVEEATFENRQPFDFEGLRGRLLSSSYVPDEGEPGHPELMEAARCLFEEHQTDGSSWSTTPRSFSARSPSRKPFARGTRRYAGSKSRPRSSYPASALRQGGPYDHRHEEEEEESHRREEDPAYDEQGLGVEPEHRAEGHLRLLGPHRVVDYRYLVTHLGRHVGAELVLELDGPAVRRLEPHGRVEKHVRAVVHAVRPPGCMVCNDANRPCLGAY